MPKFFDEMYADAALAREHYRQFEAWLATQSSERLTSKRTEADLIFRRVGITFSLHGTDAGTERLIPFDMIPRIIPSAEWSKLEQGLMQRVRALNMFLHDI